MWARQTADGYDEHRGDRRPVRPRQPWYPSSLEHRRTTATRPQASPVSAVIDQQRAAPRRPLRSDDSGGER